MRACDGDNGDQLRELLSAYPGHSVLAALSLRLFEGNHQVGLLLSSNGLVRVWLNGQRVDPSLQPRPTVVGDHMALVTLNQGWNRLLCKVVNLGEAQVLHVRFSDEPVECAVACENDEKWADGLKLWKRAIETRPGQHQFLLRRANVETRLGLRDAAKADLARAAELLAGRADAAVYLPQAYEDASLWDAALQELSRGIAREPEEQLPGRESREASGKVGQVASGE